jgi:RHS repeat-associated protein
MQASPPSPTTSPTTSPPLPADYFFTAKEFDPETGFYNFGARYLDPRFSKWMTADPALGNYLSNRTSAIHTPPNLGLYSYSWNNPSTLRDRDGQIVFVPIILGAIWVADKAYTAYTLYNDVQAVRSGEMTNAEFAVQHATDFIPGSGFARGGVRGVRALTRLGGREAENLAATASRELERGTASGVKQLEHTEAKEGEGELFRSMREAPGGGPKVGESARTLGARRGVDIKPDQAGQVHQVPAECQYLQVARQTCRHTDFRLNLAAREKIPSSASKNATWGLTCGSGADSDLIRPGIPT